MKIKDGFIAMDSDGDLLWFPAKPKQEEWSSYWQGVSGTLIRKDIFDGLEEIMEGDWRDSLRQILNGRMIMPLPELKVDDPVFVGENEVPAHFSGFDDGGNIWVFASGKTSWTTTTVDTFEVWSLPIKDEEEKS